MSANHRSRARAQDRPMTRRTEWRLSTTLCSRGPRRTRSTASRAFGPRRDSHGVGNAQKPTRARYSNADTRPADELPLLHYAEAGGPLARSALVLVSLDILEGNPCQCPALIVSAARATNSDPPTASGVGSGRLSGCPCSTSTSTRVAPTKLISSLANEFSPRAPGSGTFCCRS